jgi:hypothetical protein
MNSSGVRGIVVLLAIVCIGGALLLGGRVALELSAAQRNGLSTTCSEQQEAPPGTAEMANERVHAAIGLIPLGVWCSYPAEDEKSYVIVPPSWGLTGVASASVGLLALGLIAGSVQGRLRSSFRAA